MPLTKEDVSSKRAGLRRLSIINEAITWPKGPDQEHKVPTTLFSSGLYVVRLSKPGKEAAPEYDNARYKDGIKGNNPNDMRPEIVINGKLLEKNATFVDVFEELQKIHLTSPEGIRLVACLLGRSAYMADHVEMSPGKWRYSPPTELLDRLKILIPEAFGVPIEVFLHYLDALALNEDVKYHTLGYDVTTGTGRRNNLLTCVNVIAVLLGKVGIASFAGSFARPPVGISAISLKKMREIFPELN